MENVRVYHTDILVAGSGIAGLMAAYAAVDSEGKPSCMVITKNAGCASNHVLGFNAPVSDSDSPRIYAEDTIRGGFYINHKGLVRVLTERANQEVCRMESLGMEFDKDGNHYSLLKPLGCSYPRLVHCKNTTGRDTVRMYRQLLEKKNVKVMEGMNIADIIVEDNQVKGAVVFNEKESALVVIMAKAVILATGGIHIAEDSTYPEYMTGDGYGVAYRAGAKLTDMEFIQFEPCRCIYPKKLGISTTLLTSGGVLKNKQGRRFLLDDYPDEGSVPKDALARLIALEVLKGKGSEHGGVYMDLTGIPKEIIMEDHRLYYDRFMSAGIDLTATVVEVCPCAHSFMGGICIDERCCTDVQGLFAAGEVAGGIHGANRVGGNAGTEVYVFGNIAGRQAAEYVRLQKTGKDSAENSCDGMECETKVCQKYVEKFSCNGHAGKQEFQDLKQEIRDVMHRYMGPVRNEEDLQLAHSLLKKLTQTWESMVPGDFEAVVKKEEVGNLLITCQLSCKSALQRRESRGAHFRLDYPQCREEYCKSFIYGEHR